MTPLIHISQLFRKFFYADKFEEATENPLDAQTKILKGIINKNKNTLFGKEHDFEEIISIYDFQHNVPIYTYKSLKKYIDKEKKGEKNILTKQGPLMFGITSGTTGSSKFIPITKDFIKDYESSWQSWIYYALKHNPDMFDGKILAFVSPKEQGRTEAGIPFGSISGLIHDIQPNLVKKLYCLDPIVFRIKDYDARYYVISYLLLQDSISTIITPNPSLILLVFKKLNKFSSTLIEDIENGTLSGKFKIEKDIREYLEPRITKNPELAEKLRKLKRKKRKIYPKDIWRKLSLIACWKEGSMPLYFRQFPKLFGKTKIRDIGLMATEGRFSVPISNSGGEGVVALTSHFFEFIAEEDIHSKNPITYTLDQLELDKNYFLLVTASNGLYRYNMNDLVRVVGFKNKCPIIRFLHKGEHVASITGEKLTEWQIVSAVHHATHVIDVPTASFTATIHWAKPPCYAFYIEFHSRVSKEKKLKLIKEIDKYLKKINIEYMAKRDSFRLGAPILRHVRAGSYEDRHEHLANLGVHDAQIKHPCLVDDIKFEKTIKDHLDIIDEIKIENDK